MEEWLGVTTIPTPYISHPDNFFNRHVIDESYPHSMPDMMATAVSKRVFKLFMQTTLYINLYSVHTEFTLEINT